MQKFNKQLLYCFLKQTANELRYLKETDAKVLHLKDLQIFKKFLAILTPIIIIIFNFFIL